MNISITAFLIAFVVGLLVTLVAQSGNRVLYVHPTPDNVNDYVFKDRVGACFRVHSEEAKCDNTAIDYPRQA